MRYMHMHYFKIVMTGQGLPALKVIINLSLQLSLTFYTNNFFFTEEAAYNNS